MERQHHLHRHLLVALAGLALVGTACGTETATSATPDVVPTSAPVVVAPSTEPPATTVDPPVAEPAPTTTTTTGSVETPVEPADGPELTPTTTVAPTPEPPAVADDLTSEPAEPDPPVIDDVFYEDEPGPCTLPAMPADAVIGGEIWFDLGAGQGDHRVESYLSGGTWKLRAEFAFGAASEVEIPGAGAHGVRPIGFADVDLTYGGEELLAVVGGGASTVEVGVFAFLEGGCIHRYQSELGGDFGVLVGASVGSGEGLYCGDGYLVDWGYQLQDDDTYTMWSAAFEPVSLPVFGYVPASDDHAEGLSLDEVSASPLFDCNGLEL